MEMSGRGLLQGTIAELSWSVAKTTKNFSQYSRSPGQYLNLGSPNTKEC